MEDEGIIKKSSVFFIVFLILISIGFIIYFIFYGEKNINTPDIPDTPVITPSDKDFINETGIYGIFVNKEDADSYLKLQENGDFEFVLNVCEGYIIYNEENSTLNKNIEKVDDVYDISLTIIPKSFSDKNIIKFSGKLVSATGVVIEYTGPYSCSPSYDYKRV